MIERAIQARGPGERFKVSFAPIFSERRSDEIGIAGQFSGYASVFGTVVNNGYAPPTIIQSGAFAKTLIERGDRIRLLWQHNPDEPIGKIVEARELARGLYVKGKLADIEKGRDIVTLLRQKAIDEMSIGFTAIKWEMQRDEESDEVRIVSELKLWEISLVTFAADAAARVDKVTTHARRLDPVTKAIVARSEAEIRQAEKVHLAWCELEIAESELMLAGLGVRVPR